MYDCMILSDSKLFRCAVQTLRCQTLPAIFVDAQRLDDSFTQLADDGRTDTAGTLHQTVRVLHKRYELLRSAVDDAEQRLTSVLKQKTNFDHNYGTTLAWLHGLDKVLKVIDDEELSVTDAQCYSTTVKVCVKYRCIRLAGQ